MLERLCAEAQHLLASRQTALRQLAPALAEAGCAASREPVRLVAGHLQPHAAAHATLPAIPTVAAGQADAHAGADPGGHHKNHAGVVSGQALSQAASNAPLTASCPTILVGGGWAGGRIGLGNVAVFGEELVIRAMALSAARLLCLGQDQGARLDCMQLTQVRHLC